MIKVGSLKFTNTNKLAEDLSSHISRDIISFALPIQRGYVWDKLKKSRFILNMIEGGPTFPIYANKVDGIDYIIDGQQRGRTANSYIENKFVLTKLPAIITSDGRVVDISGKKFNELNQEFKDAILRYNFEYNFGENLSDEQVKEVFLRLNGGKALSATEIAKAQIISVTDIMELANHNIFKILINPKSIEASKNSSLVMQIYVALFEEDKCMLAKEIGAKLSKTAITDEQKNFIIECLNVFEELYESICKEDGYLPKKTSVLLKKKIHFVSTFYVLGELLKQEAFDFQLFKEWILYFFNSPVGTTTISEEYNLNVGKNTNANSSVQKRFHIIYNNYLNYVSKEDI